RGPEAFPGSEDVHRTSAAARPGGCRRRDRRPPAALPRAPLPRYACRRKNLYSEKTMTWSIAEAEACRRAAKQSDRIVQIGLQHASTGAFIDAKRWVDDGLGRQGHPRRVVNEP